MAAGLGFKTFTTGEVLTAADTNGYLMQGVLVFADAAARDAAITAPAEGQFAYTKDTNGLWYYDGSAWVASGATGDIEGVTAGVGISGGGTSGTVTVTNSMATAITTAGDLIKGTGSGTFDRLAIGSTNDVLTVAGGVPTWAAAAGGGKVLQVVQDVDTSSFSTASASFVDTGLSVTITPSSATSTIMILVSMPNSSSYNSATSTDTRGQFILVVGATQLMSCVIGLENFSSTANKNFQCGVNFSYLDSPATTSATTYKVQAKRITTSSTIGYSGIATQINSIVAIEIGA